jgi:hypothetical protein
VLGNRGYIELANEAGANYLHIPAGAWESMSWAEQGAAIRGFIDAAIARGDTFVFATLRSEAVGWYKVQYLEELGFPGPE